MRTSRMLALMLITGTVAAGCAEREEPVAPTASGAAAPLARAHRGSHAPVPGYVHTPGGVTLEPLARGAFPHPIDGQFKFRYDGGMQVSRLSDLSDVVMARLTIAEGGSAGWHRHPGVAMIVVQSGTFGVIEATDCVTRTYGPGEVAFHRGGGILDVGFNAGQGDVVAYVTFLGVPAGHAPTVGAPEEKPPC